MYAVIPTTVAIKTLKASPTEDEALITFKEYLVNELGWTSEIRSQSFAEIQELWYSKFGKNLEIVEICH